MLITKHWPGGQASNLAHTSGPTGVPSGGGGWQPPVLSSLLTCTTRKELGPPLGPQLLCLPLVIPLDHLVLMASGAYARGSHRRITNRERFLSDDYPPRTPQEETDSGP